MFCAFRSKVQFVGLLVVQDVDVRAVAQVAVALVARLVTVGGREASADRRSSPLDGAAAACCGLSCAHARVAEASRSAAVPIISLLRIAHPPHLAQERLARRGVGTVNLLVADHARPAVDLVGVRRVVQQVALVDGWRMPRASRDSAGRGTAAWPPASGRCSQPCGSWQVAQFSVTGEVLPEDRAALLGVAGDARLVDGAAGLQQLDVLRRRARCGTTSTPACPRAPACG